MYPANHSEAAAHSPTRHVTFPGSADESGEAPTLEGHIFVPTDGTLHPGVALLHANPAAGGTMDMQVMLSIEEALIEQGFATLRYNSRGVGQSEGTISTAGEKRLVAPEGAAETADVAAALDFLGMQEGVDGRRLALVGHSFGARISLNYLNEHPNDERVRGVVCIGLPVAWRDLSHLGQWPHPKLFITGEQDDFSPPDQLEAFVAGLPEPTTQVVLKNTGHFFEDREDDLAAVVAHFLTTLLSPQ
jgi:alpha/beta superfamily hydrolase